jgi:hypothetical protein
MGMNGIARKVILPALGTLVIVAVLSARSEAFSTGSTGALGAFSPTGNTTVTLPANGVLNYTTITIPVGVTVTFLKNTANTPVTMLATGDVTISGTINVNGTDTTVGGTTGPPINPGGPGGPGGYVGGQGGSRGISTATNGSGGQGPGGGGGGTLPGVTSMNGIYGPDATFVSLIPLFGGSGGGGGAGTVTNSGSSGGGGGGAIVIASNTQITVTGMILANGGAGIADPPGSQGCNTIAAGSGSGGAIRIVAPTITGTGSIQAAGGTGTCTRYPMGSDGRIRLEATTNTFTGTATPTASTSTTLGPVSAAGSPPLTNLPTVTVTNIAGITVPASPTGSLSVADVTVAAGTVNPVSVTISANNIPLGTIFTIEVLPQFGPALYFPTSGSTGTFASSTATAIVSFPQGQISLIEAFTSMTLVAGLSPLIDGEPIERILVASKEQEMPSVVFIMRSGKEIQADEALYQRLFPQGVDP